MLFYRKNIGGVWETKKLSVEDAKKLQAKIISMSIKVIKAAKEMAKAEGVELSDTLASAIVHKTVPSYDSLANDVIEEGLSDIQK